MNQGEPLDRARTCAEAALAAMERLAIPPSPPNFALWYGYYAAVDQDLVLALDRLARAQTPVSAGDLARLHRRFFGADAQSDDLDEIGRRLQSVVGRLHTVLGEAGGSTRQHGERLADLSGSLAAQTDPGTAADVVRAILSETHQIVHKAKAIETRMGESRREVDTLRGELSALRHEARTDPLTRISNRKAFDEALADAIADADRDGGALSLLFIDIDHFKSVNDRFGHAIGDEVLRIVAGELRASVKGRDVPARFGGEEFAVILPQTPHDAALAVAEHVRKSLGGRRITHRKTAADYGAITVSIGVASHVAHERAETLIERADAALYAAKRSGRNRSVSERALARATQNAALTDA